jgi:5-formyltetrahydrofolate cyclo-ligase
LIAEQRKQALRARRSLSAAERQIASEKIARQVTHSREFVAASSIGCYLPMQDEVDPYEIIERGWRANKRIFCPVMGKNGAMVYRRLDRNTTLLRNSFGLWEPVGSECISPRRLDLVITPLVAFDKNRNRIGMGGGYFDRCFSFLRHRRLWIAPKLIGVAFTCQEVANISANPWDIRLYAVYSDSTD